MTKRWVSLLGPNYTSGYPEGGGDQSAVAWVENRDGRLEAAGVYPALGTLTGNAATIASLAGLAVYGVRWTVAVDVTYRVPPTINQGGQNVFGNSTPSASRVTARIVFDLPGSNPPRNSASISSQLPQTVAIGSPPSQVGRWSNPPDGWTFDSGGTGGPGERGTPYAKSFAYAPRRALAGYESQWSRWYASGAQVFEGQTDLPLGLMRANGSQLDPNEWGGGVASLQDMDSMGAGFVRFTRLAVLVEERPTWTASVPAQMTVGAVSRIEVRAQRPGGEGIPGVLVRVRSGAGALPVRPAGSTASYSDEAIGTTGSNGVAAFECLPRVAGLDDLAITNSNAPYIGRVFDPPMAEVRRVGIAPAPGGGGGSGGEVCTLIPAVEAVPYVPARIEVKNNYGWNAGANSIKECAGAARVTFTMERQVVGVVIGFTGTRENPRNKDRITHGLYFSTSQSGRPQYQVIESGKLRGEVWEAVPHEDQYRIERRAGRVAYLINYGDGWEVFYESGAPSTDSPIFVGNTIYASGDTTP